MMTKRTPIYIENMGIACSLGLGKQDVAAALFTPSFEKEATSVTLLSGRKTCIKKVPFNLSPLPSKYKEYNSKNNSLLKVTLDEIISDINKIKEKYGPHRIGVIMATSTSGMKEGEEAFKKKLLQGEWPKDYDYKKQETSSPSEFAALYLGLEGPCYTISTACSAGGKALASARRLIQTGICEAVVVGGVDTLCELTLNGFDSLELLSEKVCNPFSKNRNGITLGEGAAVFILTREPLLSPTPIEFLGAGESSDAYHISTPDPEGTGAELAIQKALTESQVDPKDVTYINLHGTATQLNDDMESKCILRVFGDKTPCSSTKALTGHTLGAAGAIEAGILWLTLSLEENGHVSLPPHIWDGEQDLSLANIHLVKGTERIKPSNGRYIMMSNSFAFGGSNCSLIFRKKATGEVTHAYKD